MPELMRKTCTSPDAMQPALLSSYHDDTLTPDERVTVEEHLAACAACQERLASYAALGEILRSDPDTAVPATVDARVRTMLQVESARARSRQRERLRGYPAQDSPVRDAGGGLVPSRQPVVAMGQARRLRPRDRHVRTTRLDRLLLWLDSSPFPLSLRPALGATLLVTVLVGLLFGLPLGSGFGPAAVAAYPCDDPAECVIAVRFSGPVDRATIAASMQVEPRVSFDVIWQDNQTLQLRSDRPLPPGHYVLRVQPQSGGGSATPVATPVTVEFVARGPSTPVAVMAAGSKPVAQTLPDVRTAATSAPIVAVPSATPEGKTQTAAATTGTVPSTASSEAGSIGSSSRDKSSSGAVGGAPTIAPSPSPCPIQPVRGFGSLFRDRPVVAERLGCALSAERGVQMVTQPFERGHMLWRGDRREIIVLLASGKWQSYSDTFESSEAATPDARPNRPVRGFGKLWGEHPGLRAALGPPREPERPTAAVVEEFEHGLLLWTEDRVIYALYADGSWERYPDTFRDPTTPTTSASERGSASTSPTPGAARAAPRPAATVHVSGGGPIEPSQVTPVTVGTPGLAPSPTVTATPSANASTPDVTTGCSIEPEHGFGALYQSSQAVALRLGCATVAEAAVQTGRQAFERGLMLWRADTRTILVLRHDGTWSSYPDSYQAGEALADAGTPPDGRYAPDRGFGKLWREQPEVREALGWALAVEQSLAGAFQDFAQGRMLWTADRIIYVLYGDGTWHAFPDTYAQPTVTPTPSGN